MHATTLLREQVQQAQSQMLDQLGPQHVEALLAELSTTTTPSH